MPSTILTGRWVGHYFQHGQAYPISADLLQTEDRVSGFMYDGHTNRDTSIAEAIAEGGGTSVTAEQVEAQLREMVPDAPSSPVRYVSQLPPNSILRGKRTGQTVYFLKSYQGVAFGGYRVGDQLVGVRNADHEVHYEGQLSADDQVLEGRWWIDASEQHGTPLTEGEFQLRRSEEAAGRDGELSPEATSRKRPWWKFWA
jgi:hypothetical protein